MQFICFISKLIISIILTLIVSKNIKFLSSRKFVLFVVFSFEIIKYWSHCFFSNGLGNWIEMSPFKVNVFRNLTIFK